MKSILEYAGLVASAIGMLLAMTLAAGYMLAIALLPVLGCYWLWQNL